MILADGGRRLVRPHVPRAAGRALAHLLALILVSRSRWYRLRASSPEDGKGNARPRRTSPPCRAMTGATCFPAPRGQVPRQAWHKPFLSMPDGEPQTRWNRNDGVAVPCRTRAGPGHTGPPHRRAARQPRTGTVMRMSLIAAAVAATLGAAGVATSAVAAPGLPGAVTAAQDVVPARMERGHGHTMRHGHRMRHHHRRGHMMRHGHRHHRM